MPRTLLVSATVHSLLCLVISAWQKGDTWPNISASSSPWLSMLNTASESWGFQIWNYVWVGFEGHIWFPLQKPRRRYCMQRLVAERIYFISACTGLFLKIKKTPVGGGRALEKSICVLRVLQTHATYSFSLHWIKFNWFSKHNQTLKGGGEPYVWIIVIQIFHFLYKHPLWIENERCESWRRHNLTFSCLWHVESDLEYSFWRDA